MHLLAKAPHMAFTDQLAASIAEAGYPQLHDLSREVWRALVAGHITEKQAQAAAEAIEARRRTAVVPRAIKTVGELHAQPARLDGPNVPETVKHPWHAGARSQPPWPTIDPISPRRTVTLLL
jgi:hypothetical protein